MTNATQPSNPKSKPVESRPPKRVKTPTLLQMEATECGAASLGIILGYWGKIVPLEELRLACGISRDGSKASNIVKAARQYGLTTKGLRREPDQLRAMKPPMILHWGFDHFLVLEGFDKNRVYLNDPAEGPRVVSPQELDQSFSGVVLTFECGPDFQKGGTRPSLIRGLRKRLAGSEIGLTYVILASLALVIPGLVIPFFTKTFIDRYLVGGQADWVGALLIGMALTAALRASLTWLQQHYLARLETRMALTTSSQFFWHILHLPIEFYMQRFGGEIGSRVGINDHVAQLLSGQLATTVLNVIMIVFYAAIMFQYDAVLTLVGILIAALNLAALSYVSRKRVDGNRKLLQERGKLIGTSMNGLQVIETIKAGGMETDFFSRWAGYQAKLLNAEQGLAVYTQLLSAAPPFLAALSSIAIISIGGLRVIQGSLTVGMLVAFQSLMASFIEPVNKLMDLGGQLQEAEGDMNRLDDVLHYQVDPRMFETPAEAEGADATTKLSGHLELKNIAFGYSRLDPPLIENFSLALRPGERIALVGGSGSGKSTIAKVVCGLYAPWRGDILFDGVSRNQLPRRRITNSLAMVDQDIFVFEGTLRDNLTLWDSSVPESNIIQAAKDASIHEDISARTNGYDSLIEEGGRNFSGGQRQRLEIARALVNNPTILVLDEATSALDPITEKIIDENLRRRGCACLIIAHRLSTIRDCDEIIVLERGKVVQRGTHEQMIKTSGPYARLIQSDALKAPSQKSKSLLERLL
jgi:NHLM bacteriocin system ABC transporter peptidase/ATP-binding protein